MNQMKPSPASSITKAASKQTYYTIRFLVDRERVDDAYRAYAYFRWVDDVLDAVCRAFDCSVQDLRAPGKERPFTEARAVASLLVQERSHLSLTELGKALNRDISPLGRVGRHLLKEATRDDRLRELVGKIREELQE